MMTVPDPGPSTSRELLDSVLVGTDRVSVGPDGVLEVDGCRATDLVETYGSPLFVVAEETLRANVRRVRAAFEQRWPGGVNVMYAIKANNDLAVRAIFHDEGAGGDCFSSGEIHATFAGGADAALIALNGPNKSSAAVDEAIVRGMCVNLDSPEELRIVSAAAASLGRSCRVAVRLRLQSTDFDDGVADGLPDLNALLRRRENGVSLEVAAAMVVDASADPALELEGYHFHLGRESRDPRVHRSWSTVLGRAIQDLADRTGYWPAVVDVGGGLPREREPEAVPDDLMNPHPVETYADAICQPLVEALCGDQPDRPVPALWLEPGRYLAGNAGVVLTTVGIVKTDLGRTWAHVDCSINDLPRIDLYGWDYVLLAASRMDDPCTERPDVVGSLCTGEALGRTVPLPELARGDVLAVLDAGMYAETASTQYNAIPRPATVLVREGAHELIKRRETVADVFATHVVPTRLKAVAR